MIGKVFIITVVSGLFELLCHHPSMAFTSIQTNTISRRPSLSHQHHSSYSNTRRRTRAQTFLYYKDERITNDDESYQKEQQKQREQQQQQAKSSSSSSQSKDGSQFQRTIIPVIGPFPNVPTLLPGQEYVLKSPTPMQWNSIQEALSIHRKQYTCDDNDDDAASCSSIEQAPIMAFLDDHTATSNPGKGRYATIVAIVGMSSSSSSSFDNTKFDLKSFLSNTRSLSLFDSTKIRFVAVGRALLDKFFYQVPTVAVEENTDEEGYINDGAFLLNGNHRNDADATNEEEEDEDDELVHDDVIQPKQDIIMSEFRLILDTLRKNGNVMSSPVHAVAEMSQLTLEIQLLHQERQQLVKGIKAGRARIASSHQNQVSTKAQSADKIVEIDEDEWDLLDFDGIGALFGFPIEDEIVDRKTETKASVILTTSKDVSNEPVPESNELAEIMPVSEPTKLQTEYVNYGLGTRSSSVASILDLTNVRLEQLEPYYSPTRRATEEHYYEILSYVAVDAILEWITPSHIAWSVGTCTNTVERLQHINEWMDSHVSALKYEAYLVSEELIQCGEECTDLW